MFNACNDRPPLFFPGNRPFAGRVHQILAQFVRSQNRPRTICEAVLLQHSPQLWKRRQKNRLYPVLVYEGELCMRLMLRRLRQQ